ncbi:MAG: hypothetical protein EA382_13510 [Spirochaetaceae bacterium]|nr:MAG: hypothetical protein EA382_13510 [Spirochaetaceae bacterium]
MTVTTRSTPLPPAVPWVCDDATDSDVAIASRVQVARNLSGYPFLDAEPTCGYRDALETVDTVLRATATELFGEPYTLLTDRSICDSDRIRLAERGIVDGTQADSVFLSSDERFVAVVGGEDHLRLLCTAPGRAVTACVQRVVDADIRLEESLHYAVSMDLGYLSSRIAEVGTALRASVVLHLPGLLSRKRIGRILGRLGRIGCEMPSMAAPRSGLFVLRNRITFGLDESAIVERVDACARRLVALERRARDQIAATQADEIRERAERAHHELQTSETLSREQTALLASDLRFASVAGLFGGYSPALLATLFFLGKDSHISGSRGPRRPESGEDDTDTDEVRASVVRELLADCHAH